MTRAEYRDYQDRFAAGMAGFDYLVGISNTFWSWSMCELCCRPDGGQREDAIAVNVATGERLRLAVCEDCIYYAEYGRLDDSTMMEIDG